MASRLALSLCNIFLAPHLQEFDDNELHEVLPLLEKGTQAQFAPALGCIVFVLYIPSISSGIGHIPLPI